jgi:sigma-B regulation protein RsbU (phosphoserine phosphatase)
MHKSLEAAATVQKSFLPPCLPEVEGYEFGWRYLPSEYLGGDMLHLSVEGDYIICCVLDASGHGVPAALLSVTVGNHIRQTGMLAHGSDILHDPAEIMNRLSQYFKGLFQRTGQYFTMLYGALHIKTGEFRFAQAGHPFPIARCNGKLLEAVVKPNVAMGIIETKYHEHSLTLAEGDELVLYTDGVTETVRPSDSKFFGVSGVIDALDSAGTEGDGLDTLLQRSLKWGECTAFEDDATLLRIKRR